MTAPTAIELAAAIRSGERTAADVVDAYLAIIDEQEPAVHAFNVVTADRARAAATEVDRAIAAGEPVGTLISSGGAGA